MTTPVYYQLVIRNANDTGDELVLSSYPGDENPYIVEEPTGDGQSIDPITGSVTTGAYTVLVSDPLTSANTRPVTAKLADPTARQQLKSHRAYVKKSQDGSVWTTIVPGYITAVKLIDAITFSFGIGDSRRRESSKTIFKEATTRFDNTTCVIGGPVTTDFAGLLADNGGWRFKVASKFTTPTYLKMTLQTNGGFDPRKSPGTPFSSTSSAIANYTNDWARPYFLPSTTWVADDIQGSFPQLRAKLVPVTNPGDPVFLVPLSKPQATSGIPWYAATAIDLLITTGASELYLPGEDVDGNLFDPSVNDEFDIYIYAVQINEQNPLHIYEHPVDLWEKIMLDCGYVAGVDYDDSVLADLKTSINGWLGADIRLALRITQSYKLVDFLRAVIYGPFRLTTKISNGLLTLVSDRIEGRSAPTTEYTYADLASDQGTVFDTDEESIITAIRVNQKRLKKWTTEEANQPDGDSLIADEWPTNTIENSADDIPPGLEGGGREQQLGDIPGTIMVDSGDPAQAVPYSFDRYLAKISYELFQIFGRGGIFGEFHFLPQFEEGVADDVLINMIHRPAASASQSPVSQRGGSRRVVVVQRTEAADGVRVRLLDCPIEATDDVGSGGGSEEETDVTAATPPDVILFGLTASSVQATWADSYPQFAVQIQVEAHPPSDSTFSVLYDGDKELLAGTTSDVQAGIGTGWTVRARIRYLDSPSTSSWSSYSNEVVTVADSPPDTPTDAPNNLVASSSVSDTAHGEWTNTNGSLQIRINWQASTEVSDPVTWSNVAGGNRLLVPATTSDNQPTGAGLWARFRVAYVNGSGVAGPYSNWSTPTAITS